MKNRLKSTFSNDKPSMFLGTIKFEDENSYGEFEKKLRIVYETGTPQRISGVDKMVTDQKINGRTYPLEEYDGIAELYIAPSVEDVPIKAHSEFGNYVWSFKRISTKEKVTVSNDENSIVYIKFDFIHSKDKLTFSYKNNPKSAKEIVQIIEVYSAAIDLFDTTFTKKPKKLSEIIEGYKRSLIFWKRVHCIEQTLDVTFDPQKISDDSSDEEWIEILYASLIDKYPIKEYTTISEIIGFPENNHEFKEGQNLAFTFDSDKKFNILGVEIQFFRVNVAFNLIIDSIEKNNVTGEFLIKTREEDLHQSYVSYRGFINEDQRDAEKKMLMSDFNNGMVVYREAQTLKQLINRQIPPEK